MLLWNFSRPSSFFLFQKPLALILPWKDFSWPPRILKVRDNLEERNYCRFFGIQLWPPTPNTAPQYQPLWPRNNDQNWDNFVYGKRSFFWSHLGFTLFQYILKCGIKRLRVETRGICHYGVWASGCGISFTCIRIQDTGTEAGSDAHLQEMVLVLCFSCLLLPSPSVINAPLHNCTFTTSDGKNLSFLFTQTGVHNFHSFLLKPAFMFPLS